VRTSAVEPGFGPPEGGTPTQSPACTAAADENRAVTTTLAWLASIIVPGWKQLEFTRLCFHALRWYTRQPWELIVVDNSSDDRTAAEETEENTETDLNTKGAKVAKKSLGIDELAAEIAALRGSIGLAGPMICIGASGLLRAFVRIAGLSGQADANGGESDGSVGSDRSDGSCAAARRRAVCSVVVSPAATRVARLGEPWAALDATAGANVSVG
jgi:hypothetical protein